MPKSRARNRDRGDQTTPGQGVPDAPARPDVPTPASRAARVGPPPATAPGLRMDRFRGRPAIERIRPEVDGGRFPAKAVVGDEVAVEADVFADGHDLVTAVLQVRRAGERRWTTFPMDPLDDDRWRASFSVATPGRVEFAVTAWVDSFATWLRDLRTDAEAGQDLRPDLLVGQALLGRAAAAARKDGDRRYLTHAAATVGECVRHPGPACDLDHPIGVALDVSLGDVLLGDELRQSVGRARIDDEVTGDVRAIDVEVELARSSSWYELFPRSASPDPERPGTLEDVIGRLPYVAGMGFDVLYLPPIHPIGTTARKGPDGAPDADPGDPGSPWAIGSPDGGHTAVHPALGTVADVERLAAAAAGHGMHLALDLAFQCSPDHPWVREHPSWFRQLPDGSIRTAENPPKRYEDIYPLDFESDDWQALWAALRDVVTFWIDRGVTVFRCDNPHTKPFGFWEWLIGTVRAEHPETVFLSEAFTRPPVMKRLAKLGFSQSYTYFTWRHTKDELESYLTELTRPPVADYLRPNLWPNTPDILGTDLQNGSVATFCARLVLAATLSASYGIYGPPFELREFVPRQPGSEEYADSEKYTVRHWDLDRPDSLAGFVARVNQARRAHPALRRNDGLRFLRIDNDNLIAYAKTLAPTAHAAGSGRPAHPVDVIVVVVNLDPVFTQSGWLELDTGSLGLEPGRPVVAHDLLTDAYFHWQDAGNFVELDPSAVPVHLLHIRQEDEASQPVPPAVDDAAVAVAR